NIWSRSTVKLTEQVKQRAASKATASTSAGSPPPPKQLKLDFGAKPLHLEFGKTLRLRQPNKFKPFLPHKFQRSEGCPICTSWLRLLSDGSISCDLWQRTLSGHITGQMNAKVF
ncbi:Hypothetical predicted protein, partial [Scomber scombrus]